MKATTLFAAVALASNAAAHTIFVQLTAGGKT